MLGGVEVPFEQGLEGHSDADVLLHASMDALLGAAALGDIGQHFPPGDPRYKDAASLGLLGHVRDLLATRGYRVGNLDATVVAQAPRLAPFVTEMRQRIAETLRIDVGAVSVKATTTEGLGFAGRGEGIAAYAIALLVESAAAEQ
jgi:2-C-methyl-D-erythritol 4-phosphate cytidylyltransferase/2-C-methyl-D-erythritol 2,4-cyclodiphosphate synthase